MTPLSLYLRGVVFGVIAAAVFVAIAWGGTLRRSRRLLAELDTKIASVEAQQAHLDALASQTQKGMPDDVVQAFEAGCQQGEERGYKRGYDTGFDFGWDARGAQLEEARAEVRS